MYFDKVSQVLLVLVRTATPTVYTTFCQYRLPHRDHYISLLFFTAILRSASTETALKLSFQKHTIPEQRHKAINARYRFQAPTRSFL